MGRDKWLATTESLRSEDGKLKCFMITHCSSAFKDHVYRMVIVEGCCTMARLSSFRSKLFIGWHKSIVSSDWSDTIVWFGQILLYLSFCHPIYMILAPSTWLFTGYYTSWNMKLTSDFLVKYFYETSHWFNKIVKSGNFHGKRVNELIRLFLRSFCFWQSLIILDETLSG